MKFPEAQCRLVWGLPVNLQLHAEFKRISVCCGVTELEGQAQLTEWSGSLAALCQLLVVTLQRSDMQT